MKINDLVNHRGRPLNGQRHQRGILPLSLIFSQIRRSHLSSLTRHLQHAVLVNSTVQIFRKTQTLKFPEPLNMLHHFQPVPLPDSLGRHQRPFVGEQGKFRQKRAGPAEIPESKGFSPR